MLNLVGKCTWLAAEHLSFHLRRQNTCSRYRSPKSDGVQTPVYSHHNTGSGGSSSSSGKKKKDKQATRVRTVLNEQQLKILKDCYSVNSRPDTTLKERLVEMTGLSARVIRVWFQNKRCKDKKRQIQITENRLNSERVCFPPSLNTSPPIPMLYCDQQPSLTLF